jgi:hypothetical protein
MFSEEMAHEEREQAPFVVYTCPFFIFENS